MNIIKNVVQLNSVKPYDQGTHNMWTNPYISKELLKAHLNPDIGIASRELKDIEATLQMLHQELPNQSKLMDLGCGPGLYTESLSALGYHVTGVDFSEASINYAKHMKKENQSETVYIQGDYLEIAFENDFDCIVMIYCDFGALIPKEREKLLRKIYKALKPGGYFIFDALSEKSSEQIAFKKSWEATEKGFWQPEPYLALSETKHFPKKKAILDQHMIIDEKGQQKIYRFWNHYFNQEDFERLADQHDFKVEKIRNNIIKGQGPYNDETVQFVFFKKK